jgi:hypothetical protein
MNQEISSLDQIQNHTWILTKLPAGKKEKMVVHGFIK